MTTDACQYETMAWPAMAAADRLAWERIRALRPSLHSPYFTLEWCDAVQDARGDLMVVRISRGGTLVGFLPFHKGRLGAMRPAGGPLSDAHGFICGAGADIDAPAMLAALGARSYRFVGAPPDDPGLSAHARPSVAYALDLSQGYAAYRERQSGVQAKAFRNLRARQRRLELHRGTVEFISDDIDQATLAAVIELKREQYRRTGQIDVFRPAWTMRLLRQLAARQGPRLRGRLSSLRLDGKLAAGHFGLEADGVLHYWFTAYAEAFAAYSPGLMLLHRVAESCGLDGIDRIDLGGGAYRFKHEFADLRPSIGEGSVYGRGLLAGVARGAHGLARRVEALPLGRAASLPGRALSRLERLIAFHDAPPTARRAVRGG